MTTSDLFVTETLNSILEEGVENIYLLHPFSWEKINSPDKIKSAAQAIQAPLSNVDKSYDFKSDTVSAVCWTVEFNNQSIQGVTAAVLIENIVEVRVMINSFPNTAEWRNAVKDISKEFLQMDGWDFPENTDLSTPEYDPNEKLDPKLPPGIVLDEKVRFKAPIVTKALEGKTLVERAISHASAVYGDREYHHRLMNGNKMLSLWNVSVSGIRIEAANIISFNAEKKVVAMIVAFQPWPAIQLFHDRMRVRTKDFISSDYFES